ncbi:MAG: TIGR04282 family arsenosugar biosynthesis glycosyltransferase [Burkholderiales bacterium]|nr:TIGR04282 family arsenosugar biosynthesis glycosyltransferase [Burkholderiales bacterium]MDQ3195481.1 TIGR04282 family arsenosugar biosynthesis glycosyltransferase [Pseudomonadota bacterium]
MPASSIVDRIDGGDTDCRILVFAKAAVPGRVKTRLIPALGAETAAALHESLLDHTLATALAAAPNAVQLWCAPSHLHPFFQRYSQRCALRSQIPGSLGDRMAHAFAAALRCTDRAIAIGCDCPALTALHLREAAALLKTGHDAVMTPAEDGGYVLLGLTRFSSVVFERIAWSTETVLAQTRNRLQSLGWRWHETTPLWDIDRPCDYARMLRENVLSGWKQREIAHRLEPIQIDPRELTRTEEPGD